MKAIAGYLKGFPLGYSLAGPDNARSIHKPRDPFASKSDFGHALLIVGSHGKMGAATMSARACLCAGAGLLTCHVPASGYDIMQISVPEVMVTTDSEREVVTAIPDDLSRYSAVGIGPGIGTDSRTKELLRSILRSHPKPVVIDADALNILSANKGMLDILPPSSILTPHVREFERLFGKAESDFERFESASRNAVRHGCVIVLKGHFTAVAFPDGTLSFNTTGNAGMAKGGSGDVLTGIITGLLAQQYSPENAAVLGTYLHGRAGDLAAAAFSQEAMLPTDLTACIGKAFLELGRTVPGE
jgi:ADP-dependent NAD(P)H-hydrate dehydratase / NAD(P)H-hydrate epimerase